MKAVCDLQPPQIVGTSFSHFRQLLSSTLPFGSIVGRGSLVIYTMNLNINHHLWGLSLSATVVWPCTAWRGTPGVGLLRASFCTADREHPERAHLCFLQLQQGVCMHFSNPVQQSKHQYILSSFLCRKQSSFQNKYLLPGKNKKESKALINV